MRKLDIKDRASFEFTRNWFLTRNYPTFCEKVLPAWAGKPFTYLELGVFEGQSLTWMLQQVLTHPESRAVGVDPWLETEKLDAKTMDAVRVRAFKNIDNIVNKPPSDVVFENGGPSWVSRSDKCILIRGNSAEVLRRMRKWGYAGIKRGSVDLCMIDGNHNSLAVWDDARLVYDLLKPGGWMLFDDYYNDIPKGEDHVAMGVELWRKEAGDNVTEIWRHRYMVAFQKRSE